MSKTNKRPGPNKQGGYKSKKIGFDIMLFVWCKKV